MSQFFGQQGNPYSWYYPDQYYSGYFDSHGFPYNYPVNSYYPWYYPQLSQVSFNGSYFNSTESIPTGAVYGGNLRSWVDPYHPGSTSQQVLTSDSWNGPSSSSHFSWNNVPGTTNSWHYSSPSGTSARSGSDDSNTIRSAFCRYDASLVNRNGRRSGAGSRLGKRKRESYDDEEAEESRKRLRQIRFGGAVDTTGFDDGVLPVPLFTSTPKNIETDKSAACTRNSSNRQAGHGRGKVVQRCNCGQCELPRPIPVIGTNARRDFPRNDIPLLGRKKLRPVVIDGSNVAYAYGNNTHFACQGIRVCVDYFARLGCKEIHLVVPEKIFRALWLVTDGHILHELVAEGRLVTSWGRMVTDKRWVSSYDDRLILEIARRKDGIVISNDQFRDLWRENRGWRYTISHRVIGFRFVPGLPNDIFFPHDPYGRRGEIMNEIIRF